MSPIKPGDSVGAHVLPHPAGAAISNPTASPLDPPLGPPLSPRRRELLDAAVRVLAAQGLRGLTHRAVDREAGLPEGSCSAYLRTRKALLSALTEYVAAQLNADVDRVAEHLAGTEATAEEMVRVVADLFRGWLVATDLLMVKQELSLEAVRDPELAEQLAGWRSRLVDVVDCLIAEHPEHGLPLSAQTLVASLEGILSTAMHQHPQGREAFLSRSLTEILGGSSG